MSNLFATILSKDKKMKSLYYQLVNYIQEMSTTWFVVIFIVLFSVMLLSVAKFFKIYNGTQKKFEKISLMAMAIIIFCVIVFLSYVRK